ncbi:hypothetical protein M413DRAFT_442997 [Hebeloma cylindrosporum]|uniref:Uncharacterized protein n=1 Tax=Hebeloma cylindrosporum TaxID=76867 RepID=A0A0C2Y239_HEBCY|nr:hypothetical protein M413DRAFT_442997 [Hebeloma cylindrosporum h7]
MLVQVLDRFSVLLEDWFEFSSSTSIGSNYPQGIRLVVHGGACMLLHPQLYALSEQQASVFAKRGDPDNQNMGHRRTTTRDVDFIARGFLAEYGTVWTSGSISGGRGGEKGRGMYAKDRLRGCIHDTAVLFGLGEDWMNADADVALPMVYDPTRIPYDPIYTAALQPYNLKLHTIYTSPNKHLTLISVTPFWAVALKLVRYTKWDRVDVCLLLRNGTHLSGTQWTPEKLQSWLEDSCWAMGYANYDARKKEELVGRIQHAIWGLGEWTKFVEGSTADAYANPTGGATGSWGSAVTREGPAATWKNSEKRWSAHEAMGGGAPGSVVGGERPSQTGWMSSFGSNGVRNDGMVNGSSTRLHGQVSVADWGSSNTSKRKKSQSRRRRSMSQPRGEIFIPPGAEDFGFDDEYAQQFGHASDPYSFDTLDRAVQSIDRSQRQHQRSSGRHTHQQPGPSSNFQSQPNFQSRRQKDKQRKRDRMRSRMHKSEWGVSAYASSDDDSSSGLNDSDLDTDTEEADKENRWDSNDYDDTRNYNDKEARGRRRDIRATYPEPSQWDSNTSSVNNTLRPPSASAFRGPSPNRNFNGMPAHRPPAIGVSLHDPGPIPPADTTPFIPPGAAGPSHHQQPHYSSGRPSRNDPSYLAQLQFESQVRDYHAGQEGRKALLEKERKIYDRMDFSEVARAGRGGRGQDSSSNANATSWHGLDVRARPDNRPERGQRTVWHDGDVGREGWDQRGGRRREEQGEGNEHTGYRNGWMDG